MQIFGYIGTILYSISEIPQIYKIYTTKITKGISYTMFSLFSIASCNMIIYSIYLRELPILIGNIITLSSSMLIIIMKYYYEKYPVIIKNEDSVRVN